VRLSPEQPWSVYKSRSGRCCVRRWTGNEDLVAIFISKAAARDFADGENRDRAGDREDRDRSRYVS